MPENSEYPSKVGDLNTMRAFWKDFLLILTRPVTKRGRKWCCGFSGPTSRGYNDAVPTKMQKRRARIQFRNVNYSSRFFFGQEVEYFKGVKKRPRLIMG